MAGSLAGQVVALAETRQLEELAAMLEREGAQCLRCPMVSIVDSPDQASVLAWLRDLIAGRFGYVILLTGEGLRRLVACAERATLRHEAVAAFGRTCTIVRGPKPVQALKEIGLTPYRVSESPTTAGVIATLRAETIRGRTIGLQLFGQSNPELVEFIASAGAEAVAVAPYVYTAAADDIRVAELITRMAQGAVQVLVLTSSPQIDRLYEVAAVRQLESELTAGLKATRIAAVGPVVAQNLRRRGARVDICPEQGFVMKNLVKLIKTRLVP